jgi:hypothetical protein
MMQVLCLSELIKYEQVLIVLTTLLLSVNSVFSVANFYGFY